MSGGTEGLRFEVDGIVVDEVVVVLVLKALSRGDAGAAQLDRLLTGETVGECEDGGAGPVHVTFLARGARFGRFVSLQCGVLEVLVQPLDADQVDRLVALGHKTGGDPVRSTGDYVVDGGAGPVVRLRNVLVRPVRRPG